MAPRRLIYTQRPGHRTQRSAATRRTDFVAPSGFFPRTHWKIHTGARASIATAEPKLGHVKGELKKT